MTLLGDGKVATALMQWVHPRPDQILWATMLGVARPFLLLNGCGSVFFVSRSTGHDFTILDVAINDNANAVPSYTT